MLNESIQQILRDLRGGIKVQALYTTIAAWVLAQHIEKENLNKQQIFLYLQSLQQGDDSEREEGVFDPALIVLLQPLASLDTATIDQITEKVTAILTLGAVAAFNYLQSALSGLSAAQVNTHWQSIRPTYIATLTAAAQNLLTVNQPGVVVVTNASGNPIQAIIGTNPANVTVVNTVQFQASVAQALQTAVMRESPAQVMERVVRSHQQAMVSPTPVIAPPGTVSASRGAIISSPVVAPVSQAVMSASTDTLMARVDLNAELALLGSLRDAIVKIPFASSNRPTQNIKNLARLLGSSLFIKKVLEESELSVKTEHGGSLFFAKQPVSRTADVAARSPVITKSI